MSLALAADEVLRLAVMGACGVAATCLVLSWFTREYSWVDRIWSIAPAFYAVFFAAGATGNATRAWLMAALVSLWAARLTFNFVRKGGYKLHEGEDYRWAELRKKMSPAQFQVFNVFFIAAYQNVIVFLITCPVHAAAVSRAPLGALDALALLGFIAMLLIETVADNQQWAFHKHKRAAIARGEGVEPPFLTTGLFRFCRHPNFFAEQSMWWMIYLFSAAATGLWINWSIGGAVLLTLLFIGSTNFTEAITLRRYPSYADYQRRTSRTLPLPPRA